MDRFRESSESFTGPSAKIELVTIESIKPNKGKTAPECSVCRCDQRIDSGIRIPSSDRG